MENKLVNFNFKEATVRIVLVNKEPYFCLTDVCGVLEINNSSQVISRLEPKGVIQNEILTEGGKQKTNFINESNLYRVIFRSDKPQAKEFQDWVFNEVLPSIRKNGTYMTDDFIERTLNDPDYLIKIATQLKESRQRAKELEIENQHKEQELIKERAFELEILTPVTKLKKSSVDMLGKIERNAELLIKYNNAIGIYNRAMKIKNGIADFKKYIKNNLTKEQLKEYEDSSDKKAHLVEVHPNIAQSMIDYFTTTKVRYE